MVLRSLRPNTAFVQALVYELGYLLIVMRKLKPKTTIYRRRPIYGNFLRPTRVEPQLRIVQ